MRVPHYCTVSLLRKLLQVPPISDVLPIHRERASCLDKDGAGPTTVHIPADIIPTQDRKLKAQVEVLGPSDAVLERSRVFDVHFPKTNKKDGTTIAKVRVEP